MSEIVPVAQRVAKLEADIDLRIQTFTDLVPDAAQMVRLKRAFIQVTSSNPKLLDCTKASLMGALVECATLGLMPGASQQCAIVPFKGIATFLPMYQGLLDLVYRCDRVAWVKCEVVYDKDYFKFEELADRTEFAHTPTEDMDPGELRAVWLKAKIVGESDPFLMMMWKRDVLKHKARSRAASRGDSPWQTDEAAMWRKTIVKVAAKFLPKSDERISRAIYLDEQADRGVKQDLSPDPLGEPEEPVDHSGSPLLGETQCEPARKHLFAFAGEHRRHDEDNHAAIHEVIEPMGYESVLDVPVTRLDEIKDALLERVVEDAQIS